MNKDFSRLRRYRTSSEHRKIFEDIHLRRSDFIIPLFIHSGQESESVESMPFVKRYSLKEVVHFVQEKLSQGFFSFIIFPAIEDHLKEEKCQAAFDPSGLVPKALSELKRQFSEAIFIADVALDPYHPQGQDGLTDLNGHVMNDLTLNALAEQSLVLAHAGADIIAPSDMMDGRIQCIRTALDGRGLNQTLLASYTCKFHSSFYGPFRDAVKSQKALGGADKKSYQMAFNSSFQVELEIESDLAEGADILIVKPAISYLDVIYRAKEQSNRPIWAYHVSGECALLYQGSQVGLFDLEQALFEQLIAIKRAGASKIITYLADRLPDFLLS